MNFAPILIPTLNRFDHFKRCVESLSENKHANNTHLFIALDAPLKESHIDGHKKIENYLSDINGFKKVTVFKRDTNFGAVKNGITARKEIFKTYDRLIISEDDNFFSRNFLEYINYGLDKFQHDKNIFAICGHNYPVEMPGEYKENIYFWKGFSAWGFGFWRDKFDVNIFSLDSIEAYFKHPKNVLKLMKYSEDYIPALLNIIKLKRVTGDTAICTHLIRNDMVCVFPVVSKVRNYGHDGSGLHCGISDVHANQEIDKDTDFLYADIEIELENKAIYKVLKNYFDIGYIGKIKALIRYVLFQLSIMTRKYG